MLIIKIISSQKELTIQTEKGKLLLDIFREHGIPFIAPCGGKGTCGKCRVMVKGIGLISSCLFRLEEDCEIVLPEFREIEILEKQHDFTRDLLLKPGIIIKSDKDPFGMAIDVGTTTIVCYLLNLKTGAIIETLSGINPQSKYGADVISRIQYAGRGMNELEQLQKEVLHFINSQIEQFVRTTGIEKEQIQKITLAANNTMLHLLKGVDPAPLALVPFDPVFTEKQDIPANTLKLHMNQQGSVILLPSISAYIGSDIVAGVASLQPGNKINRYLFLDIGTNGELVLVTPGRIWCCATAAGPAFEGANISCGMGGVNGAIQSYMKGNIHVIGEEKPSGICGSGLIDLIAHLLENKIIDGSGIMKEDFILATEGQSATGQKISITQQDVREVQLAKSAIISGIKILLKEAGVSYNDLDALFLAGGFGNYIDIESAIAIGLLPAEMKDKIIPLGNTSGTGAVLALKSVDFEDIMNDIIKQSEIVELGSNEDFQLEFAMNMYF